MDHPVSVAGRSGQRDPRVVDGPAPRPPEPPLQDKRWLFYRHQLVGIPLLMLIVAAAVVGIFGTARSLVSVSSETVEMTVSHVSRFRYKMIGPVEITVENTSTETLVGVTVRIERRYLDQFSNVLLTPSPTSLDADWAMFELGDLDPGAAVVVTGEIQSESFGNHTGEVHVTAEGLEPVTAAISTFSFP